MERKNKKYNSKKMAQRRMFSQRVINSARFLKMSLSAQALYFHFGMMADDDGIVEAFPVMQQLGAAEDDFKVLVAKNFVKPLNDDLVSFISDWNEHNLIRADRKINSIYKDLLLQIVPDVEIVTPQPRADTNKIKGEAKFGRPMDNQRTSNGPHRLGKVRLGKVSNTNNTKITELSGDQQSLPGELGLVEKKETPAQEAKRFFEDIKFQEQIITALIEKGVDQQTANLEIKKFIFHWTERNRSGLKERWETEPIFEVKRRIVTWFGRINNFSRSGGRTRKVLDL